MALIKANYKTMCVVLLHIILGALEFDHVEFFDAVLPSHHESHFRNETKIRLCELDTEVNI